MSHELIDDVAAVLHPLPRPLPADADDLERDLSVFDHEQAAEQREETAARLRRLWEEQGVDPIDQTLRGLAHDRDLIERQTARVVALAREFTDPRRYTLERLALDLRLSPSAVRGAYDHIDAEDVASATGRRSTLIQSPANPAAFNRLVAELTERTTNKPAQAEVAGVASVLREQRWTPYPPVTRTPNPKFAKRYLRWERRWPNGTVISLYQEPGGFLAVHAKMATDDPRYFCETYGVDEDGEAVTADDIAARLAAYAERVAGYDAEIERPRLVKDEAADLRPVDFGPLDQGPHPDVTPTYPGPPAAGPFPPVPASMTKVCDNTSVGVVITDPAGRVLLFERTTPPVGRAPVAGHRDDHGSVEDAARAEVAEEVGLTVTALTPVIVRWRNNICRRQHGPIGPGHNWTVYRAEVTGAVTTDPAETRDAAWYTPAEVQHLAERTAAHALGEVSAAAFTMNPGIEPVWVQFLQELHLVNLTAREHQAIERLARRSPYEPT